MKDAPILEDINLLIVQKTSETFIDEQLIQKLKMGLDALIKLNIDDVFKVMDSVAIQKLTKKELSQFTHVISDTIDFPNYQLLAVDLMIPVITHKWLEMVILHKRISPIRPFSANPRDIFRNVIATCESLGDTDDEEVISVALRTFGGTYIHELKKSLTHFITSDLTTDNSKLINAFNEVKESGEKVYIVRKEWIIDSIKSGKVLPESDYTVRSDYEQSPPATFEYLSQFKFTYSESLNLSEEMKQCLSPFFPSDGRNLVYISRTWDEALAPNVKQRTFDFLFELIYFESNKALTKSLLHHPVRSDTVKEMPNKLVAITNYTGNARIYIEELLRRMGGPFTKTLKANNTHLVASKRVGKKYDFSKKWRLQVVSHMWVEDTFVNWKIMDELEYSSLPRSDKGVRYIGAVNFTGFKKEEITADLSMAHHLSDEIMASQERESDANSMDLHVPETASKPSSEVPDENSEVTTTVPELASSTALQSGVETAVPQTASTDQTINKEKVIAKPKRGRKSEKSETSSKTSVIDHAVDEKSDIPNEKGKVSNTEEADRSIFDIPSDEPDNTDNSKEVGTTPKKRKLTTSKVSTAKRNSKSSKQKLESSDVNLESTDGDAIMEEVREPDNAATKKITQKANMTGKPYNITAIVTGFDGELSAGDKRELKKVGVNIIENANKNLNCIIAPSLLRTQKFLTALSFDPQYLIEPVFITDVLGTLDSVKKTADFSTIAPNVENYNIWKHVHYEKDIVPKKLFHKGTTKEMAIEYMKNSRSGLLQGYTLNLSSGLAGGFDTLKSILKSYGCKDCFNFKDGAKTVHSNTKQIANAGDLAILVSNPKETKLQQHFVELCEKHGHKYVVIEWDTIVMSIFEGSLRIDKKLALKTNL